MTMNFDPQWIVGFVDGEGCFNLDVHIKKDMKWGIQMQPEFTVVQIEKDIHVLNGLKDYYGCGSVGVNRRDHISTRMHFRAKSVQSLEDNILPFFEKYKLKTKKKEEFKIFAKIVKLMSQGYHNQSLTNFLEIYDMGQQLRQRSRAKTGNKGNKVEAQIAELRKRLKEDSSL